MKKIFLLLFASMQIGTTLLAQNGFYWTVGTSAATSGVKGNFFTPLAAKPTANLQIGVGYAHTWRNKVGIGVDALFTSSGTRFNEGKSYYKPYVHIQPYLSYKINDKWQIKGGVSTGVSFYGNSTFMGSKNYAMEFGATLAIQRSFKNFDIGIKYEHYFTPHERMNYNNTTAKLYHRQLGVNLIKRF